MTHDQCALLDLLDTLRAADGGAVMRRLLEHGLQALVGAEASGVIGAAPHERTGARTAQRNGYRPRTLTTAAGDLGLRIGENMDRGTCSRRCWNPGGGSTGRCTR